VRHFWLSIGILSAAACGGTRVVSETRKRVYAEPSEIAPESSAAPEDESTHVASIEVPVADPVPGERVFAALRSMERGEPRHVRITWLGDSHTSADFWTGEIRKKLQARFGNSGPGFIPLSLGARRHEVAKVKIKGTWRQEPKSGASRSRQLDGHFGLAGRRLRGYPGASLDVDSGVLGQSRWSVLHRIEPSQSRDPKLEFQSRQRDVVPYDEEPSAGFLVASFTREANSGPVSVHIKRGQFVLWGVVVESVEPGIVVDALGINGARLRTLMAWDSLAWKQQLQWRDPDLVVLAYGTNETGDGGDMGRYRADYQAVVQLILDVGSECLLAGPTDRQDAAGKTLPEVIALDAQQRIWAEELGCLYYSPFEAMGGVGGYAAWRRHKPQLASTDGVHLTRSGYRFLADHWVEWFTERYETYRESRR
jgi:lysophospholipase L1-like esterase